MLRVNKIKIAQRTVGVSSQLISTEPVPLAYRPRRVSIHRRHRYKKEEEKRRKEEKARRAGQSKDDKVTCVFLSSRANRNEFARRGTLGEKISIRSAHHSRHRVSRAHTKHANTTHLLLVHAGGNSGNPSRLAAAERNETKRNETNEPAGRRRGDHQTTIGDDDDDEVDVVRLIVRVVGSPPSRDETDGRGQLWG